MISITCTNCQSVLTIDDAFAGGVCRCQFCGTIQTVPSKAEAALHASGVTTTTKSLYHKENAPSPSRAESSGTGLEDLAGAGRRQRIGRQWKRTGRSGLGSFPR